MVLNMDYRVQKLNDHLSHIKGLLISMDLEHNKTSDQVAALSQTQATANELEENLKHLNKAFAL